MISGRQTLGFIDSRLSDERSAMHGLERQIETLNQRYLAMQRADAEDFRALARLRVNALADGALTGRVDAAEQRVLGLLSEREQAAQALGEQVEAAAQTLQQRERERAAQSERVDQAAQALDEAEAESQLGLDADSAYQSQRHQAQQAERVAKHAAQKAEASEQERQGKGQAYRDDPLFMYLWERQYGLPAYQASAPLRWLDGKVARLIGFADARANFARLNEIPLRLREHADTLKALSEQQFQRLKALDDAARVADGVTQLEQALAQQQNALAHIDARVEQARAAQQDLMARQAAMTTGDDSDMRKAVEYLASELRSEDLQVLRNEALATPALEDDLIVNRMLQRDQERAGLETSLKDLRVTLRKHQQRSTELDDIRLDFKRRRYDRAGSEFDDGSLLAVMLDSFMNGLLDRRALWKALQQQQRYRPQRSNPTFGSGGFGRGSVWKGGGNDIGDVLGRLGGGGSRGGGGGFRTGGGF